MIQDIRAGRFHNEYKPVPPTADSYVMLYRGRELFLKKEQEQITFLTYGAVTERFPVLRGQETYLFSIDGVSYYLFREADLRRRGTEEREQSLCEEQMGTALDQSHCEEQMGTAPERCRCEEKMDTASDQSLECALTDAFADFSWEKIEFLRTALPKAAAFAGVTGFQLWGWYSARRFCPRCGKRLVHDEKERMMRCTSCGQMEYPKICPAVIVGVTNGDKILLTRYAGRTYKRYALIAGFAEIGETIEETVQREVMEEVGLKVKNIRYYKSQPWSFSDTLLMGFFAELDGDEAICLDEDELSEGVWCTREEIPEDDGVSLTREMMRIFKEQRL